VLARRRLLGVAVIVAAVLVIVLATVRPDPFKSTKSLVARFDKVQGLGKIDRNVRVGGANAGKIGEVKRAGDDVLVELEIEEDIPVRQDARVELRPHTLFEGSAFVDLHLGTPNAPELEEGQEIPKSRTEVYVSLDEATRVLRKGNREAIKDIVGSGSKVLRGEAITGLQRTLKQAPELARELGPTARALQGRRRSELSGAIRGFGRTSHAVASQEKQLAPLAERTNRTLRALDVDGGGPLDAALAALPGALEELDTSSDELVAIVNRLSELAEDLEPAGKELAPLLRGSRPLLRRATPVTRAATPLIRQLRIILARAADASPALRKAIIGLRPGAEILQESVLPALGERTEFGLPVYAQLVSAFAGGAALGRSFQTPAQSSDTGHIIRVAAYLDPQGTAAGPTIPNCAAVALINKQLADRLKTFGLCQS
jgi:phospholipid/cholesterol/gamma-HCH transport system substrate-binding protein